MNVLFASSEAFPLIKTGGLADVSGALPKALKSHLKSKGSVKLLLPGYREVLSKLTEIQTIATINVLGQVCNLVMGKSSAENLKNIDIIAIQNADLYERIGGPYCDSNGNDWSDNALRFGVLSRAASLLCCQDSPLKNWHPDILHCNDWQTGLAPAYMKLVDNSSTKSVFSIHNIAYQGCFSAETRYALGLPDSGFNMNGYEFYNQLSFLKAGLFYADKLTTVSPTYANEIQTEAFGFGLQGLLSTRKNDLIGILNGIDQEEWNPKTDQYLAKHYSAGRLANKAWLKRTLKQQLKLADNDSKPLLGVVSRMAHQKGLDLLPSIMPILLDMGYQFVILGSGDKALEASFNHLAALHPTQVSVTVGYNEALAHHIVAASDMFVMPSRYEPCGLNQLYSLAYGTPPIVSNTGGLADSVCNFSEETLANGQASGFILPSVNEQSLLSTIVFASEVWLNKPVWQKLQKNGMNQNFGWESSAKAYMAIYSMLTAS